LLITVGLLTRGINVLQTFPTNVSGLFCRNSTLTVAGAVSALAPDGYSAPNSLLISHLSSGMGEPCTKK